VDPLADWDWTAALARCRREARALLGDSAEAEDVAQEAVLRAWRARHSCRTAAARDAWLTSIARREAFRYARRRSSRREQLGLDPEEDRATSNDQLEPVERRIDISGALRGLEALDRRLIALRYEHDLTYRGTADLLGMPEGTVKVRIHRVHKRLADALSEQNR
jgi:RNA polymerase sigma-70 factor (ECF subfamily)